MFQKAKYMKTASALATTRSKNATLEFPKKSTFHILKSRRPPCVLTHKQITFFNEVEKYFEFIIDFITTGGQKTRKTIEITYC